MRTSMSCGGQPAGDATAAPVTLPQWPAVSTQSGVTSVPVQRKGPKVTSATDGYSPGLAFLPPTTAEEGAAAAPSSATVVTETAMAVRMALMCAGTHRTAGTCGDIQHMRLPPGPRMPRTLQTVAWWNRTVPFLERCRERYGKRFTMRLLQTPPFVHHSEPEHLREIFTAPPEVLHPGQGARILEPVVGANSVILLDERPHLSQRKLMLPAFHGEKMQRLSGLMQEVAERELARWPKGEPIALHPRLQALTLEIIMRAVFGLDSGERLDARRRRLAGILEFGARPASTLPALQRGRRFREFVRTREQADALIYQTIDERRQNKDGNAGAG